MNMPKIAIAVGVLLSLVGAAGYAASVADGKTSVTALIPLFLGSVFELLGVLSLAKPNLRKHLMHALAALALLGMVAALGRLVPTLLKGSGSPASRLSIGAMALLCAITLVFCIKSFRDARRAREAAELPAV